MVISSFDRPSRVPWHNFEMDLMGTEIPLPVNRFTGTPRPLGWILGNRLFSKIGSVREYKINSSACQMFDWIGGQIYH
jgi:hypothetical protein